ncbi:MAG: hypothetical protein C0394_03815 [Syntrophus sp. (in: bacteria)]|nr:hypothetical protein [Syntrophus sp. (in: bacteria)]
MTSPTSDYFRKKFIFPSPGGRAVIITFFLMPPPLAAGGMRGRSEFLTYYGFRLIDAGRMT